VTTPATVFQFNGAGNYIYALGNPWVDYCARVYTDGSAFILGLSTNDPEYAFYASTAALLQTPQVQAAGPAYPFGQTDTNALAWGAVKQRYPGLSLPEQSTLMGYIMAVPSASVSAGCGEYVPAPPAGPPGGGSSL
jgi:hypothetical protein